ncbi:MAG: hypothetical protein M1824_006540 [Vezdaea acicularis]|nr:MAG: hypothetical protein M1824_006540 [Vezdaea acicularis]
MDLMKRLVARDQTDSGLNPTMVNLLIVLLVLIFLALSLIGTLFILRSRGKSRKEAGLPLYNDKSSSTHNHRRLTITATPYGHRSQSIHVLSEKQALMENSSSPPLSPESIPEIRITFPEEEDESGARKSGRVVVVHVGDTGIGMEPVDETLPPYQKSDADRFHSLDMDRIGGLKEKKHGVRH